MELADKARVLQAPLSTPGWWREFDRKYLSSLRADGMSVVFWQPERGRGTEQAFDQESSRLLRC